MWTTSIWQAKKPAWRPHEIHSKNILNLEKSVNFMKLRTYPGCTQSKVDITEEQVMAKSEMFFRFHANNTCTTAQDLEIKPLKLPLARKKGRQA